MTNKNKKTLSGNTVQIPHIGKKTRQGAGARSKPKLGRKAYRGQGRG